MEDAQSFLHWSRYNEPPNCVVVESLKHELSKSGRDYTEAVIARKRYQFV